MSVADAINALWQAMRGSCFEATGIDVASGRRETLDAIRLQDLELAEIDDRDVLCTRAPIGRGPIRYRDVTVPTGHVRGLWKARSPKPDRIVLPELERPDGPGYMPLYCAAQWIATQGGTVDFDPLQTDRWKSAYGELLARISSDDVKVIGFRDGMREPVPGYQFAGVKMSYPFIDTAIDLILGDEMYLQSYAFTDEEDWLGGLDDSLVKHGRPKWARLVVLGSDVARLWAYPQDGSRQDQSDLSSYRSGGPGRPSAMHLVEAEFHRRCKQGSVEPPLAKEAAFLASWLRTYHPTAPPLTPKTIGNRLMAAFRAYIRARN
ncbi:hypothetical protein ASE66_12615 [Bosea sp. Root483D1]|nr:hypothetical protein ASE66_12615 [Bosea sp. Root483D1]